MHPGDAVIVREIGTAIGVEDPPGLSRAVPYDDRIGCTVVDGIAEEGTAAALGGAGEATTGSILVGTGTTSFISS